MPPPLPQLKAQDKNGLKIYKGHQKKLSIVHPEIIETKVSDKTYLCSI